MPNKPTPQQVAQAIREGKIVDQKTASVFVMTEELRSEVKTDIEGIRTEVDNKIVQLEGTVSSAVKNVKDSELNLEKVLTTIKGQKGDKGDRGDTGQKGSDGVNGIATNGVDGKPGKDGRDGVIPFVDTNRIVLQATELALAAIKPTIPSIIDITDKLPVLGSEIRNALELLQGEERLDATAIKGLDQFTKKIVGGGSTARNFYQLFDVPQSYAGQSGKILKVKTTEDGLEFGTGGGGGGTWGSITGTLSDQTDLQSALDAKASTALSNLASVAINASLVLATSDAFALGSTTKQWSDLFLAEGGVINWDNGDATLTQVGNVVTLAGADLTVPNLTDSAMTAGSVLFAGTAGLVSQDNTNFFWDDTNNQLRIGLTGAPFDNDDRVRLQIVGNVNDYADAAVQNKNAGDSATGDFFVSANNDSSTLIGHYTDFGITSSGWNPSTAGNIKTVSVTAAGTGYSVNDVLTLTTGDANGEVTVLTIGGGGTVTSVQLTNNGTGYSTGAGQATSGGGGTGCTINVLSLIDFTLWTANDGYFYCSGGNVIISTDTSGKVIKFSTGGIGTTNERFRIADTGVTVGLVGTTLGQITLAGSTSGTQIIKTIAAAGSKTFTVDASTTLSNVVKSTIGFTLPNVNTCITGKVSGFFTCPYAGTISAWNIVVDAGTATIKVWKIATGTAKPTSANSINTSGVAISSGTAIHSTTVSDFTSTAVTANDIFAYNIEAISGVNELTFNLELAKS